MEMFILVCVRFNIHPIVLFRFAFEQKVAMVSSENLMEYFLKFCEIDDKRRLFVTEVPEFVEDYCLDILAKRVKLPEITINHRRAIIELKSHVRKTPQYV
jgi:hypothetical protein